MRDVFQYVYTGQARIEESTLFQTLMVSLALGLEQLSSYSEEYLKLSLSIHTACAYLDETLRLKPYFPEADAERLLKYVMNFISEHSPECIQTPAFLNLSKEGITYLVSSDYVSLNYFSFNFLKIYFAQYSFLWMKLTSFDVALLGLNTKRA